ncbi:MAG TPA: hypothetical protein VFT34_18785 [Verrucomicrobiae bacterium]|nr:hypothetical protein [Verrucomicrobiae bacterium]
MNEHGPKPVLWSTILFRVAMLLVLLAALAVAFAPKLANLFSPERRLTTSGDPADIRLVGVVPDGDDVLLDARGNVVPGVKFDWPGKRTYTWPPGTMLREFLFELGPGLTDLEFGPNDPGSVGLTESRYWIPNTSYALDNERVPLPDGRQRLLFRVAMSSNCWRRTFLFAGRQPPVEEIDLELHFFDNTRGPAVLSFDGPFALGKTNSAREVQTAWLTPLAKPSQPTSAELVIAIPWPAFGSTSRSEYFAYDTGGKRHLGQLDKSSPSPIGGTNQFSVPGVPVEKIAAITFGEQPRVKRFHNVLVNYPDRPPRPHAVALDRLAAALGKTNTPAASLEHYYPNSTREAMTVLEYLPGHRSSVAVLANAHGSTNFSELTPAQREKLRGLAAAWARATDDYERDIGLRLGLRGPWPEFLALALARLTNGSAQDRVHAANALAWTRAQIGAEHVSLVLAIARTNDVGDASASLIGLLQRAGPAGTNALLELARADAPWLWWAAISRLPARAFEPLTALDEEMQQRLWLVMQRTNRSVSDAVRASARARLPGLLTPELQRKDPYVFSSALRQLGRYADRATAMAAMMKFLRDLPPEQVQFQPPADLVRQVNAWYQQDFGGLGARPADSNRAPAPVEWPGIVEEVLQFYEKLQRDGSVAAEK